MLHVVQRCMLHAVQRCKSHAGQRCMLHVLQRCMLHVVQHCMLHAWQERLCGANQFACETCVAMCDADRGIVLCEPPKVGSVP
jgi:hypothetical protein